MTCTFDGFIGNIAKILPTTCLLLFKSAFAMQSFTLPHPPENIIGYLQYAPVKPSDNLHKIARRYHLGYAEIVNANPTIDLNHLKPGQTLLIPSLFILPKHHANEIVINLSARRLFYFTANNSVLTAPIAIGRQGWETPAASTYITRKVSQPYWKIPAELKADKEQQGIYVPDIIPPGPNNPLGQYAIVLALPSYLIHGTNDPTTIGKRISAGCIRLYPEDIAVLFNKVTLGTSVEMIKPSYMVGYLDNHFFLSVFANPKSLDVDSIINTYPMLQPYRAVLTQILLQKPAIPTPVT